MQHNPALVVMTPKNGGNIVEPAQCQQNEMLPLMAQKGAHDGVFVQMKLRLPMSGSQP